MRLRQAHAILDIGAALLASALDFDLSPFDHEDSIYPVDRLAGCVEFTDPDIPDRNSRIYNVNLHPGPGESEITVELDYGLEPDGPVLYDRRFFVGPRMDSDESFAVGLGVHVADQIVAAIREHERPFEAAYAARTRTP